MNRSYSKIRHIQEANQRLELRNLLKENTNPPQINDRVEVYQGIGGNKLLGYARIKKIDENPLMGIAKFDVETIEGFNTRLGRDIRRNVTNFVNSVTLTGDIHSKNKFTIVFSCKTGKDMNVIPKWMEDVYVPKIYDYYSTTFCKDNRDTRKGQGIPKSQAELSDVIGGNWYISTNPKTPIDFNKLKLMYQRGEINGNTLVWTKDMQDTGWVPLSSRAEYSQIKGSSVVPPPLPPKQTTKF
jgi:hypothetical protein